MKCKFCSNYMSELDTCKFCHFEFDEDSDYYVSDDWDILNLPEENGWEHIQILDRLHLNGIDCYSADIWYDNNLATLYSCKGRVDEVARVLNLHRDVIYDDESNDVMILNLFQEKVLRCETEM